MQVTEICAKQGGSSIGDDKLSAYAERHGLFGGGWEITREAARFLDRCASNGNQIEEQDSTSTW